jgi:hypothetical protein
MFSFARLRGADPTLGVEMASTGEVACFGTDMQEAFLQALLATNFTLPQKSSDKFILVSIAEERMRAEFLPCLQQLLDMGYQVAATPGTAAYFTSSVGGGVDPKLITVLEKPTEGSQAHPDSVCGADIYVPSDQTSPASVTVADEGFGSLLSIDVDSQKAQYALDWLRTRRVDLLINIPEGSLRKDEVTAGYQMRRAAVDFGCSLLTNIKCF